MQYARSLGLTTGSSLSLFPLAKAYYAAVFARTLSLVTTTDIFRETLICVVVLKMLQEQQLVMSLSSDSSDEKPVTCSTPEQAPPPTSLPPPPPMVHCNTISVYRNYTLDQSRQQDAQALSNESQEQMVKLLEEMKEQISVNTRNINRIMLMLENSGAFAKPSAELPQGFTFPLETPDELDRLEIKLAEDNDVQKRMVQHLGTIGGRDLKHCLRTVLAFLLSTHLARQYNYLGKKGKKSLSGVRTFLKTVYDGVRVQYPEGTDSQMRDIVSNWLAGSRDRDQGRRERDAKRTRQLTSTE